MQNLLLLSDRRTRRKHVVQTKSYRSSIYKASIIPLTANLVAAYGTMFGAPTYPAIDVRDTTMPRSISIIRGKNVFNIHNWPKFKRQYLKYNVSDQIIKK